MNRVEAAKRRATALGRLAEQTATSPQENLRDEANPYHQNFVVALERVNAFISSGSGDATQVERDLDWLDNMASGVQMRRSNGLSIPDDRPRGMDEILAIKARTNSLRFGGRSNGFFDDVFDTSNYDNGQKLAVQMKQYFDALGRPKDFEARVEAIWASYETAKLGWVGESSAFAKRYYGTQMKQVGADAARVVADLEKAYGHKAGVPAPLNTEVYSAGKDKHEDVNHDSGTGWGTIALLGLGVVVLAGAAASPSTVVSAYEVARDTSRNVYARARAAVASRKRG